MAFKNIFSKKNLQVAASYEEFIESVVVKTPGTLLSFLKGFSIFLPAIMYYINTNV